MLKLTIVWGFVLSLVTLVAIVPFACRNEMQEFSEMLNPPSAAVPTPRTDQNSLAAHQQLVEKARAGGIDLYFLGDSITRRWGCSDPQWAELLQNWKQNFHGWNAGNFGWGGDRIQNILWRIENGELEGVKPKVIVILAGTNNVGDSPGDGAKIADIIAGYDLLLATCRAKAPEAKIIITAIFPRNDNKAVLGEIDSINRELAKRADGISTIFLNVNDRLADAEGNLFDGMAIDGLHLGVKGYQVWAEGLRPILTQLLGPRAETDHAPPPTGDPSIATFKEKT
jgi:lysophospholipase L1-like esterase